MFNNLIEKTIVLDNNQIYQVIWVTIIEEKNYICLLQNDNYSKMIIGELIDNDIKVITDKELLVRIINKMNSDIAMFIL